MRTKEEIELVLEECRQSAEHLKGTLRYKQIVGVVSILAWVLNTPDYNDLAKPSERLFQRQRAVLAKAE